MDSRIIMGGGRDAADRTIRKTNRVASFLRRGMYPEALACAEETVTRLLPLANPVRNSDLVLLASVLIGKTAALVLLGRYDESRFAARKASQMMWLLDIRSDRIRELYTLLAANLHALHSITKTRGSLTVRLIYGSAGFEEICADLVDLEIREGAYASAAVGPAFNLWYALGDHAADLPLPEDDRRAKNRENTLTG